MLWIKAGNIVGKIAKPFKILVDALINVEIKYKDIKYICIFLYILYKYTFFVYIMRYKFL